MIRKIIKYVWNARFEICIIAILLGIAAFAHGVNMFHFPYYENDEGSYSSYAWSLLTYGRLSPYTYWYDHAPAGWILIALWELISGGFFTFGFSINSGRVLMLILHIFSTLLLYIIGKKLTKSKWVGFLSGILFSIAPLAVYFQRRVLLDNIMVFWVLLSIYLIVNFKQKLRYIMFSALAFGVSVLSKENSIFFIPVIVYLIYIHYKSHNRLFAITQWIAISGLVISLYFIYALISGEFFPNGTLLGGTHEHVSILTTLHEQFSKPGGGIFNPATSSFWGNMRIWLRDDPYFIYGGILATLFNLLVGIRIRVTRIISFFSIVNWIFLMRGGIVNEFYILPLFPFLALNIATAVWSIHKSLYKYSAPLFVRTFSYIPYFVVLGLFMYSSLLYAQKIRNGLNLYSSDQTTPQIQAVNYILSRKRPEEFYVIDNYGLIDLWVKNSGNFAHAEWYWKVDKDKDVSQKILNGSPQKIDYLVFTPQMEHDIPIAGMPISLAAWHNAKPVQRFWKDGWGVEFWATNYPDRVLKSSWYSYKQNFIKDGKTIIPNENNKTTSEAQSYSLLRAVYMNDKSTFDNVLAWSEKNLQQKNALFSWQVTQDKALNLQQSPSPDADQDIALSLLFAYKKWRSKSYLEKAKEIINGIWDNDVITIQHKPYVTAGIWASNKTTATINPSYLSPAHYRIFAQIDKKHPWIDAIDTSYAVLQKCTFSSLDKNSGELPPEWCAINKTSLNVTQADKPHPTATEYSHNAIRVPWRVALDYQWFKDPKAKAYLSQITELDKLWKTNGKLVNAYQHDGSIWENYESVTAYAGDLAYFSVTDPKAAKEIYNDKILKKFYEDKNKSYWEDPNNYYTQNWAWFGTALYTHSLPNLWDSLKYTELSAADTVK